MAAVLNKEDPTYLPDIPEEPDDLDMNLEPSTKEEIVNAIKELKNREAQHHDQQNASNQTLN